GAGAEQMGPVDARREGGEGMAQADPAGSEFCAVGPGLLHLSEDGPAGCPTARGCVAGDRGAAPPGRNTRTQPMASRDPCRARTSHAKRETTAPPLCDPGGGLDPYLRVLCQRPRVGPFFVPEISRDPAAQGVRLSGNAAATGVA